MTVFNTCLSQDRSCPIVLIVEPGSENPKETLALWDQLHGCNKTVERAPDELLVVGSEGEGVLTLT